MDPSYTSSDDESAAMAKAMGFSTFGTQGPSKKRKFNPSTDAIVDGQALKELDKGGKKGQGSGGNQIPLGRARVFGVAKTSNSDEIALDENDGDDEEPAIEASLPPPNLDADASEEEEPQYVDTSLPPPDEAARAAQERIDAILAQASDPPDEIQQNISQSSQQNRGIGHLMAAFKETANLAVPSEAVSVTSSQRPRERGQKNELWYVGYYDPSFNENPWKKLEEAKGWSSSGTWVERPVHWQERGRAGST